METGDRAELESVKVEGVIGLGSKIDGDEYGSCLMLF